MLWKRKQKRAGADPEHLKLAQEQLADAKRRIDLANKQVQAEIERQKRLFGEDLLPKRDSD